MSSVLRTALAATSLGAAAAFGFAGTAAAAPVAPDAMSQPETPAEQLAGMGTGMGAATGAVLGASKSLQLNPMNGGGVNPLSNTVGTDVGDGSVDSGLVTGDVANGMTVGDAVSSLRF